MKNRPWAALGARFSRLVDALEVLRFPVPPRIGKKTARDAPGTAPGGGRGPPGGAPGTLRAPWGNDPLPARSF